MDEPERTLTGWGSDGVSATALGVFHNNLKSWSEYRAALNWLEEQFDFSEHSKGMAAHSGVNNPTEQHFSKLMFAADLTNTPPHVSAATRACSRFENAPFIDISEMDPVQLLELAPHMQLASARLGCKPRGLNYLSCFSGAECGGQALLKLKLPWNLLVTVELDRHAQRLLSSKFPSDPIKRTITLCPHLFDGERYIGPSHVVHL